MILAFIIGSIFGSFLNVVVYRLKTRQNMCFGGSFCPECKARLKWHDLVPILSFVFLYGHCRYCRKKISWQYPIVEILSGLIWIGVFYKLGISLTNLYYIFILSCLLVVAVYDFRWRIIPDKIIYPAIAVALIYNISPLIRGDYEGFLIHLFAAIAAFLFFFLIFYFSKGRAMGLGDAKLAFLIGFFLGPLEALMAFALSFIIGAIFGIILLGFGKKSWKSQIALGPFLVLGVIIVFFFL